MPMSSYEVVRRAVEFDTPDRLPIRFSTLGLSDMHNVNWNQIGTGDHALRETLDEWGCTWVRSEVANMGQVKGHPLADWRSLDDYRWPDPDNPAFYEGMEARFAGSDGKYITTGIFMLLFERMHALHGFESTLRDLFLERERIEMLADRIVEIDLGIIDNIGRRFPGQIHGFSFTDDWGTEQAGFISPRLWDEFFKPRYKRLFDAMHAHGWHVWMHSCGKVNAYIDSLIEIGVNVINLQQPRVFGDRGDRPPFRGPHLLRVAVRHPAHAAVRERRRDPRRGAAADPQWGTPEGGFVLSDYGDGQAIGVPLEKKQIMLDAFLAADRWAAAAKGAA